jgi:hypothetical protein
MKARFAKRLARRMFRRTRTFVIRMRGSHLRAAVLAHSDRALDLMQATLTLTEPHLRGKHRRQALCVPGEATLVQAGEWKILCGRDGKPLDPRTQVVVNRDKIVRFVRALLRRKPDGGALALPRRRVSL